MSVYMLLGEEGVCFGNSGPNWSCLSKKSETWSLCAAWVRFSEEGIKIGVRQLELHGHAEDSAHKMWVLLSRKKT